MFSFIDFGFDGFTPWNARDWLDNYRRERAERRARQRALNEYPEFTGQAAGPARAQGEALARREQRAPLSATAVIGYRVQLEGRFDHEIIWRPLVDVTRVEDFVLSAQAASLEVRAARAQLIEWPPSLITKPSAEALWDSPVRPLLEASGISVAVLVNARRLRYSEYWLAAGQRLTACGALARRLGCRGEAAGYRHAPSLSELGADPQLGLLLRPSGAGQRAWAETARLAVPEHAPTAR